MRIRARSRQKTQSDTCSNPRCGSLQRERGLLPSGVCHHSANAANWFALRILIIRFSLS
jgi:hypothetical protein